MCTYLEADRNRPLRSNANRTDPRTRQIPRDHRQEHRRARLKRHLYHAFWKNQHDRNTFELLDNYWPYYLAAACRYLSGNQIGSRESILKTSLRVDGGRDDANQANGE